MSNELLVLAVLIFLLAGTIKGVLGIGLPTTAISLLTQFTEPANAIVLLLIPMVITNIWQVIHAGEFGESLRRLWPMALCLMVCMWLTARLSVNVDDRVLILGIGVVIVLFAATSLVKQPPAIPARYDRLAQVVAGCLAGVMGGMTAIWAPPMMIYLLSLRLSAIQFVRFIGFLFLFGATPLLIGYWQNGVMTHNMAAYSALMVIPTLSGFALGALLRGRLNAERFRQLVLLFFVLMGLNLIRRAVFT